MSTFPIVTVIDGVYGVHVCRLRITRLTRSQMRMLRDTPRRRRRIAPRSLRG